MKLSSVNRRALPKFIFSIAWLPSSAAASALLTFKLLACSKIRQLLPWLTELRVCMYVHTMEHKIPIFYQKLSYLITWLLCVLHRFLSC